MQRIITIRANKKPVDADLSSFIGLHVQLLAYEHIKWNMHKNCYFLHYSNDKINLNSKYFLKHIIKHIYLIRIQYVIIVFHPQCGKVEINSSVTCDGNFFILFPLSTCDVENGILRTSSATERITKPTHTYDVRI